MNFFSWKLRRELSRIQSQIKGRLVEFIEPSLRARHDSWLAKVSPKCGARESSRRIAIFLLHQPDGIAHSTIESCKFLTECGFSVFLVSNAPITFSDHEQLRPWIWRIMERPNFGYDFGGYRDGIHWLWKQGINADQLILVNDSIWFPVLTNNQTDWLQKLCDHPSSFCGVMELAGHRTEHRYRRQKPPFLGSFFLLFKYAAIESAGFKAFWRDYKMTSNKQKTISRGERGISAAMAGAGFNQHALFRRELFDEAIFQANATELLNILSDLNSFDDTLKIQQQYLVQHFHDAPAWIEQARATAFAITNLQNLLVTAPISCVKQFSLPVFKKAQTHQNLIALRAIAKASSEGRLALNPIVEQELNAKLN